MEYAINQPNPLMMTMIWFSNDASNVFNHAYFYYIITQQNEYQRDQQLMG